MAELADALDLGSNSEKSVGSSPISRTNKQFSNYLSRSNSRGVVILFFIYTECIYNINERTLNYKSYDGKR